MVSGINNSANLRGIFLVILVNLNCFFPTYVEAYDAVTYSFSGGRLGDNLVSYLHAKWFAFEHAIPLIYNPFPYSEELVLEEKEFHFADMDPNTDLFISTYFPEIKSEFKRHPYSSFAVDWKNDEFRKLALEMLKPKQDLQLTTPPKNMVSVAIHVREGGNLDPEGFTLRDPLKCPPIDFYAKSLERVLNLFHEKSVYCYLFTDALQPQEVAQKIIEKIPAHCLPITIEYRKVNNCHNLNVLEDFFSLFLFDVLIRPESNFSIVPSLLHDYAILCYPQDFSIEGEGVTIDHVYFAINDKLLRKIL